MIKEFPDFIAKGNVMDMAVGIIIGAAFTAIVTSLVDDLINPLLGLFIGGIDFSAMSFGLWVVLLLVKAVNRVKDAAVKKDEPVPRAPNGPTQEEPLMEIRDALKSR
jgi:large conductance mechanosensitive channel